MQTYVYGAPSAWVGLNKDNKNFSLPVIDALYAVRAGVTKIKINNKMFSPVIDALCAVRVGGAEIKIKSIFLPIYALYIVRAGGRNEDKIEFFQYAVGYDGKGR